MGLTEDAGRREFEAATEWVAPRRLSTQFPDLRLETTNLDDDGLRLVLSWTDGPHAGGTFTLRMTRRAALVFCSTLLDDVRQFLTEPAVWGELDAICERLEAVVELMPHGR